MGKRTGKLPSKRMLSSLKHGVTAGILPDEQRAWRQHVAVLRADLRPVGAVEEALAERVALALWRLKRVAVWEAALISEAIERAAEAIPWPSPLVAGESPARTQAAALGTLYALVRNWVSPLAGTAAIVAAARDELASQRQDQLVLERVLAGLTERGQLTGLAAEEVDTILWPLLDALDPEERCQLAQTWGVEPDDLAAVEPEADDLQPLLALLGVERTRVALAEALRTTGVNIAILEEGLAAYERATAERQVRAWPDLEKLQLLQRYEGHLERTLYRALHELEARQAQRQGQPAPLARLEVYGEREPPELPVAEERDES